MDKHSYHNPSRPTLEPPTHDGHEMVHRGDLADPRDIDHQAMTEAEHAAMGHAPRARQACRAQRRDVPVPLLDQPALSIPVVLYSPMVQEWLRFSMPVFPGSDLIPPVLGTIIFLYGGTVFLRG